MRRTLYAAYYEQDNEVKEFEHESSLIHAPRRPGTSYFKVIVYPDGTTAAHMVRPYGPVLQSTKYMLMVPNCKVHEVCILLHSVVGMHETASEHEESELSSI